MTKNYGTGTHVVPVSSYGVDRLWTLNAFSVRCWGRVGITV